MRLFAVERRSPERLESREQQVGNARRLGPDVDELPADAMEDADLGAVREIVDLGGMRVERAPDVAREQLRTGALAEAGHAVRPRGRSAGGTFGTPAHELVERPVDHRR